MEDNNFLLPVDILDVESKPDEYYKRFIIPSAHRGYHIKTEPGIEVYYCIQKEDILKNMVLVKVPANTTKLYVYPMPGSDEV